MASKIHNSEKKASPSSEFTQLLLRKLQESLDRKNQNPGGRTYIKELVSVYRYEISCMMHTLGDVARPLKNSVQYLETILRDQINLLLMKASEVPRSKTLNHENFLTLLVNNREKMTRLLHYLFLKDCSELLGRRKYDLYADAVTSAQFGKRVKTCLDFLKSIGAEDYDPETIKLAHDSISLERIARRFQMSMKMTNEQYLEFSKKQRICFYPKGDGGKFKDWLLADKVTTLKPTAIALDILSFFARETVAEIVEASLPINRPKPKKPVRPDSNVPSSSLKINSESTTDHPHTSTNFDLKVPSSLSGIKGLSNVIADDSVSNSNINSLTSSGSLGMADVFGQSMSSLNDNDLIPPTKDSPSRKKRKTETVGSCAKSKDEISIIRDIKSSPEFNCKARLQTPKISPRNPGDPITVEDLKTAVINVIFSSPGTFHMKKKRILCL